MIQNYLLKYVCVFCAYNKSHWALMLVFYCMDKNSCDILQNIFIFGWTILLLNYLGKV